jgi:hypothetical protein
MDYASKMVKFAVFAVLGTVIIQIAMPQEKGAP